MKLIFVFLKQFNSHVTHHFPKRPPSSCASLVTKSKAFSNQMVGDPKLSSGVSPKMNADRLQTQCDSNALETPLVPSRTRHITAYAAPLS